MIQDPEKPIPNNSQLDAAIAPVSGQLYLAVAPTGLMQVGLGDQKVAKTWTFTDIKLLALLAPWIP